MPYKDPEKRKEMQKRYRESPEIREKLKEYHRKYSKKYEARYHHTRRVKRWIAKMKVLEHYSKKEIKCECCNIREPEFLTIDHIWGRGNVERKRLGIPGGSVFYLHLIKMGFPPGYRVLCFNCNFAMGAYRICPHVLDKIRIAMEEWFTDWGFF